MPRIAVILVFICSVWCNPAVSRVPRNTRRPRILMMEATAFARATGPTASGTAVHVGIVAADPRILPLGTRIRISGSGPYDGNYLVADTGAAVKGMHIDIYLPSAVAAKRFGVKTVSVMVRQIGTGTTSARREDTAMTGH